MRILQAIVACAALASPAGAEAPGWCDLVFKDVAHDAHFVVLAEVHREKQASPTLHVVDVLKGPRQAVAPQVEDPGDLGLEKAHHVLLALDEKQRPVGNGRSMGACTAISVLPIRDGKLRSRDRRNYDSGRGDMTLEELRQDLAGGTGRWIPVRDVSQTRP